VLLACAAVEEEDDPEGAGTLLEDALERYPDDPLVLVIRAAWEIDNGSDLGSAQALLEEAVARLEPLLPEEGARALYGDALRLLAESRAGLFDLGGALLAAGRAVELMPADAQAHYTLAWVRFVALDLQPAEMAVSHALTLDGTLAEAYRLRGLIAGALGRPAEADRALLKANALDPDSYSAPVRVSKRRFAELVAEALRDLPPLLADVLEDVPVDLELRPSLETLRAMPMPAPPDVPCLVVTSDDHNEPVIERLVLFQENLEVRAGDEEELLEAIIEALFEEVGLGADA
jgi:tetratricopeptide (TPR) repeat protein